MSMVSRKGLSRAVGGSSEVSFGIEKNLLKFSSVFQEELGTAG